ncbi:MAG: putative leader peptide [Pseudonocardiaceae bacterium]
MHSAPYVVADPVPPTRCRHVTAFPVFETVWLSERLHIDLLRLTSAMCCAR